MSAIYLSGYTVDDNVYVADDYVEIYAGATTVLLGDDTLHDDFVVGAGRASVRGPTTIEDGLTLGGSVLAVNMDTITQTGQLFIGDTATVRNIASATWNLEDATILTEGGRFTNLGVINETGNSIISEGAFIDRAGTINVGGYLSIVTGADRFVNDTIDGAGVLTLSGVVLDGSDVSTATLDMQNVRVIRYADVSSANVEMQYVNLGGGANLNLTNANAAVELPTELVGSGALNIKGDDSVTVEPTMALIGAVTFANYGDTTFSGDDNQVDISTKSWANDQVTIANESGAVWTDTGASSNFTTSGVVGSSVFINQGTFIEDTTFGASFDLFVVNDGTMEAGALPGIRPLPSSLRFDDAVSGDGAIEIGNGVVTFADAVSGGETVDFNSAPGIGTPTLVLNDPSEFGAVISGFAQNGMTNDQILVNSTNWQFEGFQSNSDGTGGALMLTDGAATASLNLTGAYDAAGFHALVSGSQTTITYSG